VSKTEVINLCPNPVAPGADGFAGVDMRVPQRTFREPSGNLQGTFRDDIYIYIYICLRTCGHGCVLSLCDMVLSSRADVTAARSNVSTLVTSEQYMINILLAYYINHYLLITYAKRKLP
jgi:hypothetical protein